MSDHDEHPANTDGPGRTNRLNRLNGLNGLNSLNGLNRLNRPTRLNRPNRPNRPNVPNRANESVEAAAFGASAALEPALRTTDIAELRKMRAVLDGLIAAHDSATADSAAAPEDGRYLGGDDALALDLRVDLDELGIISGDLFAVAGGQHDYLASFRTVPQSAMDWNAPKGLPIALEDAHGTTVTGFAWFDYSDADRAVFLSLVTDGALPGLPANQPFEMSATWTSRHLRTLGLEFEREAGTEPPPTHTHANRKLTYREVLSDAGFEVIDAGTNSTIPAEEEGWGTTQLHALMTDFAQAPLNQPAWRHQLLWLNKSTRSGLLGVMFDTSAAFPRQGSAVFEGAIRGTPHEPIERKLLQTAVHEIGHGLNLVHPFEREVGRADSTSIMTYDWKYRGGGRSAQFWDDFNFSFDPEELEFLRHGRRQAVIPGGAPFHSVNYWASGNGGYVPYLPEAPLDVLSLSIEAPPAGNVFGFGQPVLLGATLTNLTGGEIGLDWRFLDPKAGFLEILVRRVHAGSHGTSADFVRYQPILERTFDLDPRTLSRVAHGEAVSNNLNLTFGSAGFTFAEPGSYEIQAIVALPDNRNDHNPFNDRELIVASNRLRIHVAYPQSRAEETQVVSVLHRPDVGTWFALGGSSALEAASNSLEEVLERQLHGQAEVVDPIAANILRCQGIDAGRRYKRFYPDRTQRFRATNGKPEIAVGKLEQLGVTAMNAFDRVTAKATKELCEKHRRNATPDEPPGGQRQK